MRKGGGKKKGAAFEREICKSLSLWLTKGKKSDCFWRSAMSGGRATVHANRGVLIRQAGDIAAVSPEGERFLREWFIEVKHVKDLDLKGFFLTNSGKLRQYWIKACREAKRYSKDPMIIAKQNNFPIIVLTKHNHLAHIAQPLLICSMHRAQCDVTLFSEWMNS